MVSKKKKTPTKTTTSKDDRRKQAVEALKAKVNRTEEYTTLLLNNINLDTTKSTKSEIDAIGEALENIREAVDYYNL